MTWKLLKRIRIAFSLLTVLALGFIFVDFSRIAPTYFFKKVTFFQFIPSMVEFTGTFAITSAGFLVVIILTLLFGRVYCSFLCPLGAFQDILIRLSALRRKRKQIFKHQKPYPWIWYGILALVVLIFLAGSMIGVSWFDPYSNFGRIFSNLFRPVLAGLNNLASMILEQFDNYSLPRIDYKFFSPVSIFFSLVLLVMLGMMTYRHGRMFCNTLCPVGAFLGLISRISLFRIVLDKSSCNSCGKCSLVCKSGCIDVKKQEVDFTRCVGCLNCLTPCPDNGVKFWPRWKKSNPVLKEFDVKKRETFGKIGLLMLLLSGTSWKEAMAQEAKKKVIPKKKATVPVIRDYFVSPPGAGSTARFIDRCTACHLCVSTCPTGVLQPSFLEYGIAGMMVPYMNYSVSFCNFECIACTQVCPTGAIQPLTHEVKKLTQLGKVQFIIDNCVVKTEGTDCGACSEHCPTKAVYMVPYKEKLLIPEINPSICIGCGACEYACPTDPKSIYVNGHAIHQIANAPEKKKEENAGQALEEFPF